MTVTPESLYAYSNLFSRRFEEGLGVPSSKIDEIQNLLLARGFEKQMTLGVSTTYFTNSVDGSLWSWRSDANRMVQATECIVRFRQRFLPKDLPETGYTLCGEGDLEIKAHHPDPDRSYKTSLHVPENIGIERLIHLSHTDRVAYCNLLLHIAKQTEKNAINARVLVAHTHRGLAPIMTRVSTRDTFVQSTDEIKVTIDDGFSYFAYPFWEDKNPVFYAPVVERHSGSARVEVKSKSKTPMADELLGALRVFKNRQNMRPDRSMFLMREKALKENVLVVEDGAYEIETKIGLTRRSQRPVEEIIMEIYAKCLEGQLKGFQISRQFPDIERRSADSATYHIFGWVDEQHVVHDVCTAIVVVGESPVFWLKYKGDNQLLGESSTLKRRETKMRYEGIFNEASFIQAESERLRNPIQKIGNVRKHKVAYKIQETHTGRLFNFSHQLTTVVDPIDVSDVLEQIEIEYVETVRGMSQDESSVQASCKRLASRICALSIEGVQLQPTSHRLIDWLYQIHDKIHT